jgi:signal transduction histidine kinase
METTFILCVLTIILNFIDSSNLKIRWFSACVLFFILKYNFQYIIFESTAFYFLFILSIEIYKDNIKVKNKFRFYKVLVLFFLVLDLIFQNKCLYHNIIIIIFILFSYYFILKSYFNEKNIYIKKSLKNFIFMILTIKIYIFIFEYIEILKYINDYIVYLFLTYFIYSFLKYGLFGIKMELSFKMLSEKGKIISSGTSVFNHTLKNELAKISVCSKLLSELIIRNDMEEEFANRNIKIIENSINHLENLSIKIREYSEDFNLEEEEVDICLVIKETIKSLENTLRLKKIKINIDFNIRVKIKFDSAHLKEVFLNILKNAIEASKYNSRIDIGLNKYGKSVIFYIRDYGKGINKEKIGKIFEPFYSTKDKRKSFGLGLSYCKNVIHKHGGDIKVKSKINEGTTFSIVFNYRKIDYIYKK